MRIGPRFVLFTASTSRTLVPEGVDVSPVQIRPLGGTAGCLTMFLVSVIASVLLTVLLNVLFR